MNIARAGVGHVMGNKKTENRENNDFSSDVLLVLIKMRISIRQPISLVTMIRRAAGSEKARVDAGAMDSAAFGMREFDQAKSKPEKVKHCFSQNERLRGVGNMLESTAKMTILLLCLHSVLSLVSSISSPTHELMKRNLVAEEDRSRDTSFRQPRMLQVDDSDFHSVQNLVHHEYKASSHAVHISKRTKKSLNNSKKHSHWQRDPLREGDCEPMHSYQETSFPSCNLMHEMRMESQFQVLTHGGYNSVFKMVDIDGATHIVKILESGKDYTDRNFDRVRRDSLIMERASGSDYVVDIYSYCGFSQVVEYGPHGNLDAILDETYDELSQSQKLQIATQAAKALADVHDLDGTGISSMSHGDFASKQYIFIDGRFKLNDFNRGRFIRWNNKLHEPCTYTIGSNDGKFRSPEEYNYIPETAAIDVWALGSILVEIISGEEAWNGYEAEAAQQEIAKGKLPPFHQYIETPHSDPINQVLLKAIDMCYVYEAKDRPKAGAVLEYLDREAKRLGVEWNTPFVTNKGGRPLGTLTLKDE